MSLGKGDVAVVNDHVNLNIKKLKKYSNSIFIVWEPPVVIPEIHNIDFYKNFTHILTWNDKLIDDKKYIQIWYPVSKPMSQDLPSFRERKLVCLINGNKTSSHFKELYSKRLWVIDFYENRDYYPFDLYGTGWECEHLRCYKGSPEDKSEIMKQYRFTYAFENYDNDCGYITEKIFDAFSNGTIPIYLGAANIRDYIPDDCFIDMRTFNTLESLHYYIESIDEKTFLAYQENIRRFLDSEQAKKFTHELFIHLIVKTILK